MRSGAKNTTIRTVIRPKARGARRSTARTAGARTLTAPVVAVVVGLFVLTGCGSSNYLGGSSVTTVASVTSGTVDLRSVKGYGDVLVTSSGQSLYLLTSDPPGASSCVGSCAVVWPPLVAGHRLKAGPGVKAALLSSFTRSDGVRQVLYNKHALYTYEEDSDPGMVTGQGVETYGGIWWLVSPDGQAITK
jgi:predicted lipoprotein with Yx(FWY)xxD motif